MDEATTAYVEDPTEEAVINDESGLGSEAPTPVEESAPAIFRFTEFVHIPDECGGLECKDPEHFHAWLRLPNKFQHKEIREKALAARARRVRVLRDTDSDSRAILEDELDQLRNADQELLVEEIIDQDGGKDLTEAIKDVAEIEDEHQVADEETTYKYAHIDDDEERLQQIEAMPEDERPTEERQSLTEHVHGYYEAITARQKELQDPQRQSLLARPIDELIDMVRQDRIDKEGMEEFLHAYHSWMIVYGTMLANKSGRKFKHLDTLTSQAPEVVDALVLAFSHLESEARAGNS